MSRLLGDAYVGKPAGVEIPVATVTRLVADVALAWVVADIALAYVAPAHVVGFVPDHIC